MEKNKIKNLLIFGTIILSFLFLSFLYIYSKSNLTVVATQLPNSVLKEKVFSQLLAGQKIIGEFTSKQNYLGEILIRFDTYNRINSDKVYFRIKEIHQKGWYYENLYDTNQFLPNEFFNFGFPAIGDSKNKTYYFEIQSVKGLPQDSITLSQKDPLIEAVYQYPKSLLIKNPNVFKDYVQNKINNTEVNEDLLISMLGYIDFVFLAIFVEYLFLFKSFENNSISLKKIRGSYFVGFGLLILIMSAILLYIKKDSISENLSVIGFFVLALGVIIIFFESIISKNSDN